MKAVARIRYITLMKSLYFSSEVRFSLFFLFFFEEHLELFKFLRLKKCMIALSMEYNTLEKIGTIKIKAIRNMRIQ